MRERESRERNLMRKPRIEKFSLQTITRALSQTDLESARESLAFAIGASLEISGKVLKFVKRDELCRLVIEAGENLDLTVFADFKRAQKKKMRKGSAVMIRGKFQSFGASAVCLIDCRLVVE